MKSQDELATAWNDLEEKWSSFSTQLKASRSKDGGSFKLELAEPLEGIDFEVLSTKIRQTRDYVDTLAKTKSYGAIPTRSKKRILSQTEEAAAKLKEIRGKFDQIDDAGGIGAIEDETLSISSADGVVTLDIAATYRDVHERLDNIVYEYSIISHFLKVEGTTGFYFRKQEVDRIVSQIEKESSSIRNVRRDIHEAKEVQSALLEQLNTDIDSIEEAKAEIAKTRADFKAQLDGLVEKIAKTDTAVTSASSSIEAANQLKAKVEAHDQFIAEHAAQLEELKSETESHLESATIAAARIAKNQERINELETEAEHMLKGATVAGLASEFGKIKRQLEDELSGARIVVYISAAFLLLSVFPILLYVFGPAIGLETNGPSRTNATIPESLTSLAMRSVLLIPASWFARFAAKRHDRLFKLKEHYAYKYSLATAVEGFKKQAPQYQDDIAAETFFELTFNPAERLDARTSPAKRRNSKVLEAIRKRMESKSGSTQEVSS